MNLMINGQARVFADLQAGATVQDVLLALGLKQDRIAVEYNGAIVPRSSWPTTNLSEGDKLEIVHFVGGGNWNGKEPPLPSVLIRPAGR